MSLIKFFKIVSPTRAGMIALSLLLAGLLSLPCYAQFNLTNDTSDISNMSLEDIMSSKSQGNPSLLESQMGSKAEVGSFTPIVTRRSPSIVSVITDGDIERSGARDLIDVLNMIPGFDFNVDNKGVIGISVRGNWANEGKVLLLMDGQELNETLFGTIPFGNRYPVEQIKKVEIIRGPGSAIYGGDAEYAVINIITKGATDIRGVQANVVAGQTADAMARNNYTLSIGRVIKNLSFSLTCFMGNSIGSDKNYTDIYGNTYNLKNNSQNTSRSFNFGMAYKGFSMRVVADDYNNETRDGYDLISNDYYNQYFRTFAGEVKYEWKPDSTFTIIPKLNLKVNSPWEIYSPNPLDTGTAAANFYRVFADRYTGSLTSIWQPSKVFSTTFGAEEYYDRAVREDNKTFTNSGSSEVSFTNAAAYAQSLYKNQYADVTIGARYDYNSAYGSAFVPRMGLTKRIDKLNLKLLYSGAFKAPTIENVESSLTGTIKPETTKTWELQGGYELTPNMFVTANVFDIRTENTIIYYTYPSDTGTAVPNGGYINSNETGSRGFELEYKFVSKLGFLNLNYSYYSTLDMLHDSLYADPYSSSQALGISNHKLNINSSINVTKDFYASPSITFNSAKTGITGIDAEGAYTYSRLPATYMVNLYVGKNNLFIRGLNGSIGVYNLLGENFYYAQAYASGHAPLPAESREFLIKLNYRLYYKN